MISRLPLPPDAIRPLVMVATIAIALLTGVLLAHDIGLGMTFVAALVFVPLAFAAPPVALAAWLVALFLAGLPGVGGAASRALLIVFVVWVGAMAASRVRRGTAGGSMGMLALVVVFVLWLLTTLLWAPIPEVANEAVMHFMMAGLVFLMVTTLVTEPRHARWLAWAFVIGCVLSVLSGVVADGLTSASALATSTSDQGRLQGGTGDPNYLAAAIVPAMILGAALAARRGRPLARLALMTALAILAAGLAATQSRGGFLAIAVVALGALALWRGRRLTAGAMIVVLAVGSAAWFTASPAAWERVTSSQDGGSGRTDIWTVAWRAVEQHPIVGVGLSQFPIVSPQLIRQPGSIDRGDLLVANHSVVHNVYLQLWVEAGMIGLLLFIAIVLRSFRSARLATHRFDANGDADSAMLAQGAMLALLGALTASFFLSNASDQRLWLLLGLCVALLGIAQRNGTSAISND